MKETIPILLVAPHRLFGVQVDDFSFDNENSPGPQETHVRRIYEAPFKHGCALPVESKCESECLEKFV